MSFKIFSFNDWLSEGGSAGLRSFALNSSYERMCWVYACVNRIATSASSAPLVFYQGKPDRIPSNTPTEKERITDREHPVYQLFNPPKPPTIISLQQLMYRTFIHESIDGLIFWLIERKGGKAVSIDLRLKTELRPILEYKSNDPSRPVLRGWEDSSGKKHLPEDVLPIDSYNPKDPLAGLSRLSPSRISLESEFSISGWNSAFFKSGMKNPLLIQAKGQLTREQKKEIRSEIVNYYSGIDGAHGALLMQGGVEVKPLVVNPKDVDFIRGKELNREEILAVFGVPPAIVGIFSYSNYSNVREQIRIFWEHTLLPKMNHILELIQFNILDRDFPGVYAAWDLSKVAGLAPDPIEIAAPASQYHAMGYSPSQTARILKAPVLEPDKDFKKPEPIKPQTPDATDDGEDPDVVDGEKPKKPTKPKKPKKDPNAGDPKPSDKPKPDNNNAFVLSALTQRLKLFFEYVSFKEDNEKQVLTVWEDVVLGFLKDYSQEFDLSQFNSFPKLLCEKPTEAMRQEFMKHCENIAEFMVRTIYKMNSRL